VTEQSYHMKPNIMANVASLVGFLWLSAHALTAMASQPATKDPTTATWRDAPKSRVREFLERDYLLGDWWPANGSSERADFEFYRAASNVDGDSTWQRVSRRAVDDSDLSSETVGL
jgi:hypothetical protein